MQNYTWESSDALRHKHEGGLILHIIIERDKGTQDISDKTYIIRHESSFSLRFVQNTKHANEEWEKFII